MPFKKRLVMKWMERHYLNKFVRKWMEKGDGRRRWMQQPSISG
jgi:hypothetical protein